MNRLFGWDLPPGVTPGMIPGNRPEDEYIERRMERLPEQIAAALEPLLGPELAREAGDFLTDDTNDAPFLGNLYVKLEADYWDERGEG